MLDKTTVSKVQNIIEIAWQKEKLPEDWSVALMYRRALVQKKTNL